MKSKYSIPLSEVINEFRLEEVYMPSEPKKIMITSPEVSRPGLAFSGFVEIFEPFRIQIVGKAEHKYLSGLPEDIRKERIDGFFALKPVAVVITTNLYIYDEMLAAAEAGFGGCMIGSFSPKVLASDLDLPSHLLPQLVLALGKPDEAVELTTAAEDGSVTYYREGEVHFVQKRSLEDLIL